MPHCCEFYPGICLTTEQNARENLSKGKKRNRSQGKKKLFYIKHQCLLILLQSYLNMMTYFGTFDVRKSVHHHTIQINQPTRYDSFTSLLLDVCVWLGVFRAPFRPSSGAYSCIGNLWFYRWRVAVAAATTTRQR